MTVDGKRDERYLATDLAWRSTPAEFANAAHLLRWAASPQERQTHLGVLFNVIVEALEKCGAPSPPVPSVGEDALVISKIAWDLANRIFRNANFEDDYDLSGELKAIIAALYEARAILAALPQHGWQDIASAPKDRLIILSWDCASVVGSWVNNLKTSQPWAGWKPTGAFIWPKGEPDAWQPLPQPLPPPPAKEG